MCAQVAAPLEGTQAGAGSGCCSHIQQCAPACVYALDAQAGTGTWNGPAPTGAGGRAAVAEAEMAAKIAAVPEPDSIRLFNGTRLPMIGLGTAGIKSADSIK